MISSGFTAWKENELYNLECFSRIFITLGWFWWVDMASSADTIGSGGPIYDAMLTKYLLKISATSYGSVTVFFIFIENDCCIAFEFFVSKEWFNCSPEIVVRLFAFLWEILFDGLFSNGHNFVPMCLSSCHDWWWWANVRMMVHAIGLGICNGRNVQH